MRPARPVYIHRIGHVSALGLSASAAAEALLADRKNLSWRELPDASAGRYPWFALPLPEEDWTARTRSALRLLAVDLMGGRANAVRPYGEVPLFIGSSAHSTGAIESFIRATGTSPPLDDTNAFNEEIAAVFGCNAPPWMFSTACTSGLAALEAAFILIASGDIDEALVLGIEFGCETTLAGFASLGLLARTEEADGLILGEALAGLRLSARPCPGWRVAACRLCIDGYAPTMPTPDGRVIAANLSDALDDACLGARDIDLIKPHRVRLPSTDEAEEAALELLFGSSRPPEVSFKSRLGHTLGASGPAELTALLALLDTPAGQARHGSPQRLLFNLVGFGGSTATLILDRAPIPGAPS